MSSYVMFLKIISGVYDADGGHGENTFGWKSLGQELRINDVTADLPSFQHGHRALAAKDMRKSQGGWAHTHVSSVAQRTIETHCTQV